MTTQSTVPFRDGADDTIGVVVVSPNETLRRELVGKLRSPHWRLTEAEGGADALDKLGACETDLLLLDPRLPDLDSNEFNALVRSKFPDVQIVTVNSHTGQPLLRSSSPTPLAVQVMEVLEQRGACKPARQRRSRWKEKKKTPAYLAWLVAPSRCSVSMP